MTYAGFSNGYLCQNCDDINGTHTLTLQAVNTENLQYPWADWEAYWYLLYDGGAGCDYEMICLLYCGDDWYGEKYYYLWVNVQQRSGATVWDKYFYSNMDCTTLDEDVPLDTHGLYYCNFDGTSSVNVSW